MKRYAVEWIIFALGVIALGGVMIGLPEMDKVWLWVLWGALALCVSAYVYVLRFCTTGFRALSIVVYVLAWVLIAALVGLFELGSMPQDAATSLSDLLLAGVLILVSLGWIRDPRSNEEH